MKININSFLQLKKNSSNIELDESIIVQILSYFDNNDNKKSKKAYHKKNNKNIITNKSIILNKPTLINKNIMVKDNMLNKIKLILNKLSQNNIHNLILEFINNIKINSQEDFNNFLKIIYVKILSEIKFVKVYLDFLKNIICLYNRSYDFNCKYLYDLIEYKFKYDYFNTNFLPVYENMSDDYRINNLKLIREMVNLHFLNNSIIQIIDSQILQQTIYISDIYEWFKNTNITSENIKIIKNLLDIYINIDIRDKILLQNLISDQNLEIEPKKNKIIFLKKNNDIL